MKCVAPKLGVAEGVDVREVLDRRIWRGVAALSCCGVLTACGAAGTPGFEAPRATDYSLSSIGNLLAFNKLFPDSTPLPTTEAAVDCPTVEVQDGTASVRVYKVGSQSNTDVRYGFSLGDVARECSKIGDKLQLKVGVEGRVLIGPAGSPGTFSVPVRIAVRNDATQQVISSQLSRVTATVEPGNTQAAFTYVTEPFAVPFIPHPDEDYAILVGFDSAAKDASDAAAPKRRKRVAKPAAE